MIRQDRSAPKVIFHADDLGLSLGFNEGILDAALNGLLTSTCIRVNGAAYADAIARVVPALRRHGVGIGLHLNIVEGKSSKRSVAGAKLCDSDGRYRLGFAKLWLHSRDRELLGEIEADFREQIERALADLGNIEHLNSHQHSHAVPAIFDLTCRLALEYGIPHVRLTRERFYVAGPFWRHLRPWYAANLVKWLVLNWTAMQNRRNARRRGVQIADGFVGVLYTGHMRTETVLRGVARAARYAGATVEVLLHPARILGRADEIFLDSGVRDYVIEHERHAELDTLTGPQLDRAVRHAGWTLQTMSGTPVVRPAQKPRPQPAARLRTIVVLDETPFYQPGWFQRLLGCPLLDVVAVAIVKLPNGGLLQSYLLANWRRLGVRPLLRLGCKSVWLRVLDRLPRFIRGDFTGSCARVAEEFRIPHRTVQKVNTDEFRSWVKAFDPDLIVSSNSLVFGEDLLRIPKLGCINRHSALLPSLGGVLPVFRAIQFRHSHTGVSVHRMVRALDKGEVLSRKYIPIFPDDSLDRLYQLCFTMSYEATVEAVTRLRDGSDAALGDDAALEPSYYSFPTPADWREFNARGIPFIQ
jgi:predicted glycoside hydrolase/deacetylase ChbG (UPF0249 family)/folate-dependent phosphoribosylglycinamide formyltransferase PurN